MRLFLKNAGYGVLVTVVFFAVAEGVLFVFGVKPVQHTEDIYVGFASGNPLYVRDAVPGRQDMMVTAAKFQMPFPSPTVRRSPTKRKEIRVSPIAIA